MIKDSNVPLEVITVPNVKFRNWENWGGGGELEVYRQHQFTTLLYLSLPLSLYLTPLQANSRLLPADTSQKGQLCNESLRCAAGIPVFTQAMSPHRGRALEWSNLLVLKVSFVGCNPHVISTYDGTAISAGAFGTAKPCITILHHSTPRCAR